MVASLPSVEATSQTAAALAGGRRSGSGWRPAIQPTRQGS